MKADKTSFSNKINDPLNLHDFYDQDATGEEIFYSGKNRRRFWAIILTVFCFLAIATRLFFLQVQEGFVNLKLAEGNHLRNIPVSAPRGIIVDDSGKPLVENQPVYQLVLSSSKKKQLNDFDPKVFDLIGMSKDEVSKIVQESNDPSEYLVIKDKIARDDAMLLKSRLSNYDTFEVTPSYQRQYPDEGLCHVLGYVGRIGEQEAQANPSLYINATSGKSGLEKTYDQYLQGLPGYTRAEVDAGGKVMRLVATEQPQAGDTIQTSIDKDLQDFVAADLKKKTDELHTNGVAIVMDPRDGSIKASVSLPNYDNNQLSSGVSQEQYSSLINDPNKPLYDRTISGSYPPGSTIKPFIATTALEDGVIDPNFSFDTPPFIQIGQTKFPDWKDHGVTDIRNAIAESNNVFFFTIGGGWGPVKNGLGPDRIAAGLEKFGFGKSTQTDLTAEGTGFIPTPDWKKKTTGESWFIGNTYNMSIGQGDLLVTPMQIAVATASIANGGTLYRPHLVTKITDGNGRIVQSVGAVESEVKSNIFKSDNLNVVRQGMRQTITGPNGSATSAFGANFPLTVAGKTGTAQYGNEGKTHAWFTSFAPYDNPQIVVTVLVEGGGEGYAAAAPVAKDIYTWWMQNRQK